SELEAVSILVLMFVFFYLRNRIRGHLLIRNREINTNPLRRNVLNCIIGGGARNCIWELRMSVDALGRLCELHKVQGGLSDEYRGYLGALDGIYIDVTVPEEDKSRYQTRKGKISTNVLGVCNRDMNFVYVLSGWEGSVSDSRVLRDAISRRNNLMIPIVDVGYTNCKGFLAPYKQTRYH
ncbi:hypothetical protein S83_046879, partial [Arachis hypogaea]